MNFRHQRTPHVCGYPYQQRACLRIVSCTLHCVFDFFQIHPTPAISFFFSFLIIHFYFRMDWNCRRRHYCFNAGIVQHGPRHVYLQVSGRDLLSIRLGCRQLVDVEAFNSLSFFYSLYSLFSRFRRALRCRANGGGHGGCLLEGTNSRPDLSNITPPAIKLSDLSTPFWMKGIHRTDITVATVIKKCVLDTLGVRSSSLV